MLINALDVLSKFVFEVLIIIQKTLHLGFIIKILNIAPLNMNVINYDCTEIAECFGLGLELNSLYHFIEKLWSFPR